jgi:hypothetical protein
MTDPQAAEDRVSAYWDALVLGQETAGIDLDPELAAAIEQFQALSVTPSLAARERVWRRLAPGALEKANGVGPHSLSGIPLRATGPASTAKGHHVAARRHKSHVMRHLGHWALTHLATAALLLLTLAVGFATIWQGPATNEDASDRRPALIRAADTAPGDVIDELLFEATFATEELPASGMEAIFYRITLPPGVSLPYLAGPACARRADMVTSGVGAEVIQSGAYALRLDTTIEIQRGGASQESEEILARTEVVLGPGDIAIYPDYTGQGSIRSIGDEPVVIVGVAIVSIEGLGVPAPQLPVGVRAEQLSRSVDTDWRSVPAGPLTVSLWRLMLPEGTNMGPYEGTGLEALLVESGMIERGFLGAGESTPSHVPLFRPAGASTSFIGPTPSVRRTIANARDEPAELLVLIIEPAGAHAATLAR